jgi:hypothetical protein
MAFYWSAVGDILKLWHSIGQPWGIFSSSGIPLVSRGEYSQALAFYWSAVGNILKLWHSIGQPWGIFSSSGILLDLVSHKSTYSNK